jgi:superfamily II DNA or RNA helicase
MSDSTTKPKFVLDPGLWPAQTRSVRRVATAVTKGFDVCLQSPTGTGKTRMATELLRWADHDLGGGCFYVNRKILVEQTAARFKEQGLHFGVRAADHEENFDPYAPIQICSADTERARVYGEDPVWERHDCGLVIVDEAHIQKGATMQKIIADHKSNGAKIVLLSATPVSLAKMADVIITGGTMKEYRDCGALVPAVVKSIEQPDVAKVKRTPSGEYDMGDKKRKIYTQSIVGNVIARWKEFNPDARPSMLYAPGKAESVWFAQQFENIGVPWCHIDATEAYFGGKRYRLGRKLWQDILGKYSDGTFKGVSSRFKLREGVDVPETYHIILATPIGSIQSYLQTVGRGLRAAPDASYTKDHCLVTDHGGNYHRHGSPNLDRDWKTIWTLSSAVASKLHEESIRNGDAPEPIRCPKCMGERLHGVLCPHCGHEHAKSQREVIMEDGTMVTKDGGLIPRKRTQMRSDTQESWNKMYWGYKNKNIKKTFSQMEAFFTQTHGYRPPRTLDNMPLEPMNWHRRVADVHVSDLRTAKRKDR